VSRSRTLLSVYSFIHLCPLLAFSSFFFFFFQAEDGIRDPLVTGVQTCALPILVCPSPPDKRDASRHGSFASIRSGSRISVCGTRSEERRVGKECRSRWWAEQ